MCKLKNSILYCFVLTVVLSGLSCNTKKTVLVFGERDISNVITRMTDIMVHDITNPPLAARFFSYACLTGYEIVSQHEQQFKSMHGVLNEYPAIAKPDSLDNYSYQLAAVLGMLETAKRMQPSGKLLDAYQISFIDSLKNRGVDVDLLENSQRYALEISKQVLAYAKADGYNKISNLSRYTPVGGEGSWFPTPPGFMAAVEPYFNKVRPFTLDSAAQFKPLAPVPFSKEKKSSFYELTAAVHSAATTLTTDQREIAGFWDCNPYAIQDGGHLQYGFKKISPGAHWLGITGIACEQAKTGFDKCLQTFTAVSIGLMDAFICCWDEKFRSNRIRPETAIRKFIDPEWQPLLQTPPFPEYLSGHSSISLATATILTKYLGDEFAYTDSVEVSYNLPPRKFTSFHQAAKEAAISRFYGGIHFMDAIDNGMSQGAKVGEWVLKTLE